MILEIELGDFKAFHSERITLRGLTVLVGENNSGKSSILAAIRLLAQTVRSQDPSLPLLFDGPYGDFGSFRDVVHGNHRGRPMTLGVTVPLGRRGRAAESQATVSLTSEFKYRLQRRETVLRSTKLRLDSRVILAATASSEGGRLGLSNVGGVNVAASLKGQMREIVRTNGFIPSVNVFALESRARRSGATADLIDIIRSNAPDIRRASDAVQSALRHVEVIGAMREPPARTYLHSGSVSRQVGAAGENWGSLVALASSQRTKRNFMRDVSRWMRNAGIAAAVDINWLSDRHFELMVEHPVTGERENISDVGRGTSQVLPVIVGGYRLDPGDTYLVEEPEIHLHPRAQAALGDYFVELQQRGVQTIVETHSEYLITRLQQHIAAGRIRAEDVIFYYVRANEQGKTIQALELDTSAAFKNAISGGFFPQRLIEASELAKARARRVD